MTTETNATQKWNALRAAQRDFQKAAIALAQRWEEYSTPDTIARNAGVIDVAAHLLRGSTGIDPGMAISISRRGADPATAATFYVVASSTEES